MGTCLSIFPYIFDDFVLDVADVMQESTITSASVQAGLSKLSSGDDACDGWRGLVLLYTLYKDEYWVAPETWIDECERVAIQATSGACAAQWWGRSKPKQDGAGAAEVALRLRTMANELRLAARSES